MFPPAVCCSQTSTEHVYTCSIVSFLISVKMPILLKLTCRLGATRQPSWTPLLVGTGCTPLYLVMAFSMKVACGLQGSGSKQDPPSAPA